MIINLAKLYLISDDFYNSPQPELEDKLESSVGFVAASSQALESESVDIVTSEMDGKTDHPEPKEHHIEPLKKERKRLSPIELSRNKRKLALRQVG